MDWSLDPGNIIIGLLTIGASYHIAKGAAKGAKEDIKKFVDVVQKAANEAEKNRKITQRAALRPHLVSVKKMIKSFDEKIGIKAYEFREMRNSLLQLLDSSDRLNFLKPIEPLVDRLIIYNRDIPETNTVNQWCNESRISRDMGQIGLRKIRDELERIKSDDLELKFLLWNNCQNTIIFTLVTFFTFKRDLANKFNIIVFDNAVMNKAILN